MYMAASTHIQDGDGGQARLQPVRGPAAPVPPAARVNSCTDEGAATDRDHNIYIYIYISSRCASQASCDRKPSPDRSRRLPARRSAEQLCPLRQVPQRRDAGCPPGLDSDGGRSHLAVLGGGRRGGSGGTDSRDNRLPGRAASADCLGRPGQA